LKIEETRKGLGISIHVYTNDKNTAIDEAIAIYLETKQKCENEEILVAPMEVIERK